jgi:hypothetical protein
MVIVIIAVEVIIMWHVLTPVYNVAGYSDTNLPRVRVSATSN